MFACAGGGRLLWPPVNSQDSFPFLSFRFKVLRPRGSLLCIHAALKGETSLGKEVNLTFENSLKLYLASSRGG